MKLYIAGPMSGCEDYNYPAFMAAQKALEALGYEVENPASGGQVEGWTWSDYMRRGIAQLVTCDGVAMLPGWRESRGARIERQLALDIKLTTYDLGLQQRTLLATVSAASLWRDRGNPKSDAPQLESLLVAIHAAAENLPDPRNADEEHAEWSSGDSDEAWEEVLRVARMERAHVKTTWIDGDLTRTFETSAPRISVEQSIYGLTATISGKTVAWRQGAGMHVVATAPKPSEPEWAGDRLVLGKPYMDAPWSIFEQIRPGEWQAIPDQARCATTDHMMKWVCIHRITDEKFRAELAELMRGGA